MSEGTGRVAGFVLARRVLAQGHTRPVTRQSPIETLWARAAASFVALEP
jgi:hypothetical protein